MLLQLGNTASSISQLWLWRECDVHHETVATCYLGMAGLTALGTRIPECPSPTPQKY